MQVQPNLTSLCFQASAVLRTRFAHLVIFGSVLLLIALIIVLELHLVGHTHVTPFAARHIAEGSPDVIATSYLAVS